MSLKDRPYWRQDQEGGYAGGSPGGGLTVGLSKPPPAVRWLLIINVAVFILQLFLDAPGGDRDFGLMSAWLGTTIDGWWQVWRYVTSQFLHSTGSLWHLGLNMLGLYMLGTPLEQRWGSRRFLAFYLVCGVVGGLAYVLIGAALSLPGDVPIVGASGGVYAIVLACAVLFPHFRLILFVFPVPIRLAAVIVFGAMALTILQAIGAGRYGPSFWSDVAHVGGAVAAAAWIALGPLAQRAWHNRHRRTGQGAWQRKMQALADEQAGVDEVLKKIHDKGIASLTKREKKILQDATRRQQGAEREINRL